MDIKDTLFQSLLRQQNITEFRAFRISPSSVSNSKLGDKIEIGYRYVKIDNIYAYIKNDIFHVCNEQFEEIKLSEINFYDKGLQRIGYNDMEYYYPYNENDKSLVIDSNGKIVIKNPKEFFYIGTNEFLEDTPIFIEDYEKGLLYDCINNKFITPLTYDFWVGYKTDYKFVVPKLDFKKFIVYGSQNEQSKYLFSIRKQYYEEPPHILSYFKESEENSISIYDSWQYGSEKIGLKPICLWYAGRNVYAITIKLINQIDSDGNIIHSEDKDTHSISFEVRVTVGWQDAFCCISPAILEYRGYMENKYDLEYFYKSLEIIPTKSSLLILSSDNEYYRHHAIIINDEGKITLCTCLECASVALTENNILRLGRYTSDIADYYDICGTKLCSADIHCPKPQIFTRGLKVPNTFNYSEIQIQKTILPDADPFFGDDEYTQFQGVIELQTGKVIIPPCYSRIQLKEIDGIFGTKLDKTVLVSIVQIDNFYNGVLCSYYGIYLNNQMILPLAYTNIQYAKYKIPHHEKYSSQNIDNLSFEEVESNFLVLEKDGHYGVASNLGTIIIKPCANSFRLLEKYERHQIKRDNDTDRVFIRYCAAHGYISLCKDGLNNLIFQNSIISDFVIDDFEIVNLKDCFDNEHIFIKVICNGNQAIIYNGKYITEFYHEVQVYHSNFGSKEEHEDKDFVVVATDNNGKSCLLNSDSKVIIDFGNHNISPYMNYVKVDSVFLNKDKVAIFDSSAYSLVDDKHNYRNEHLFCFNNDKRPSEYYIIDTSGELKVINVEEETDDIEFALGFDWYRFDKNNLRFERIIYEEDFDYGCYDYDDFDYERETFYALGGDDYDEWKNKGGNIDDMMDWMGY